MKKTEEQKKLCAEAKSALENIGRIIAGGHKERVGIEIRTRVTYGRVVASIVLTSPGGDFEPIDREVVIANMNGSGIFRDVRLSPRGKRNAYIKASALCEHGHAAPRVEYREFSVGELVRFVQADPRTFPHGLDTKISLGDFEGNSYHRNVSLFADGGMLHIGYEMNEV